MVNDLSIPMLLLSFVQGAVLVTQSIFDMKFLKQNLVSNRFVVALLLMLYNWLRTISGIEETLLDAVFFVLCCGLLTSSLVELGSRKPHSFWILSAFNALFFGIAYYTSLYLKEIGEPERYLILSVVLTMYFIAYGTVSLFRGSTGPLKLEQLGIGILFVMILFGSLLVQQPEIIGVLTLNLMFIGLFVKNLLEHYYFNASRVLKKEIDTLSLRLAAFNLTKTELKIAALVLQGFSVMEMANQLYVSENTIHKHCSNINKKTNCTSTTEFVQRFS